MTVLSHEKSVIVIAPQVSLAAFAFFTYDLFSRQFNL
jgi:hypothetical protein